MLVRIGGISKEWQRNISKLVIFEKTCQISVVNETSSESLVCCCIRVVVAHSAVLLYTALLVCLLVCMPACPAVCLCFYQVHFTVVSDRFCCPSAFVVTSEYANPVLGVP